MRCTRIFVVYGMGMFSLAGWLPGAQQTAAQNPPPPKTAAKTGLKTGSQRSSSKRGRLTKADVQKLWAQKDQQLLLNELRLRGLAFEPDEDFVNQLPNPSDQPLAIAELRKMIPPAPDIDAVARAAPELLAKVKDAAQKRNDSALEPLLYPDLMANKAPVYDLFDITNYRGHTLGKFAPLENRRVGVQFFQLTTSQVESLHYVAFSNYHGKLVVHDVVTGPQVATLFLRDEEQLAKSKLDLVFRALNDGDETGLKNLCTEGFYESLKAKTGGDGGSILTRGQHISLDKVSIIPSVTLDQKSIRVVVQVGYPTASGKPLQYYIDFERIDNDLKVVRARDLEGGVIAWDPNIDNYLNRRYGLPDGSPPQNVPESDDPNFYSSSILKAKAARAIQNRDAKKLKECAEQFLEREPGSGEGYGIRASAQHMLGHYDEATVDAVKALDHGGTVYFDVLQYSGFTHNFAPIILAVSGTKIEIRSAMGGPGEQIAPASVKMSFDKPAGGLASLKRILDPVGPFLKLEVARQKNKTYKFAAVGTTCPDASTANSKDLEVYPGGGCGAQGTNVQNAKSVDILVPHEWFQDLKTIQDTVEHAKQGPSASLKP